MRTFYEVLGVSRNATSEEILKAYRKRCIETHPDKGGKEIDFLNVRKGYEILSNSASREKYDEWVRVKEQEEKNRVNSELLMIKKRVIPFAEVIISKYCLDSLFKTMLLTYLYGENSIYENLDGSKLDRVLAGLVVQRILGIIIVDKTYDIKSVMEFYSICEEVILGKKDIQIVCPNSEKESSSKAQKKENSPTNWSSSLVGIVLLAFALILIWVICQQAAKIGETRIESAEQIQAPKKEVPEQKEEAHEPKKHIIDGVKPVEDIEYLYSRLNDEGYAVGTFDEFKMSLKIKEEVDWYYDKGKEDGFIAVDRKSFYKIVGYKWKEKAKPKVPDYKEIIYQTGDMPYASYYGSGKKDVNSLSELRILNYSSSEAVLLLENYYGSVVRHVYIKNNSSYTIKYIPEGRYKIKVMYGNSWNGGKDNGSGYPKGGFMKNVSFSKSKDNDLFDFTFEKTYDGVSYPQYSVTLHKVVNGNMKTENIDEDEFF